MSSGAADAGAGAASARLRELRLPVSRVKTIMKSSPNVDTVGAEPLFLVTKVTELFIAEMARTAYASANSSTLDYKHLAEIVQTDDTLDFLREIMPRKMTVREYRQLMAQKATRTDSEVDSSTDTSSSDSSADDDS